MRPSGGTDAIPFATFLRRNSAERTVNGRYMPQRRGNLTFRLVRPHDLTRSLEQRDRRGMEPDPSVTVCKPRLRARMRAFEEDAELVAGEHLKPG